MRVALRRVQSRCRGSEVASESPDTQLNGRGVRIFHTFTKSTDEGMGGRPPNPLPPRDILM